MKLFRREYRTASGRKRRTRTWWVSFSVRGRRYRRSTGIRTKQAAALRAGEMIRAAELRAAGVHTYLGTRSKAPSKLADDYETELERRGRVAGHVATVTARVKHLLEGTQDLAEVTPQRITRALRGLADGGLTPKTCNEYRSALHGFYAWLVRTEQWGANPVAAVSRQADHEPERKRRALSDKDLKALVEHAGRDRGVVYLTAARTGLRRGELRGWRWRDVDLEARVFRVRASVSKDRKEATLPLDESVAEALQGYRRTLDPDAPIFPVHPDRADAQDRPGGRRHRVRDARGLR